MFHCPKLLSERERDDLFSCRLLSSPFPKLGAVAGGEDLQALSWSRRDSVKLYERSY